LCGGALYSLSLFLNKIGQKYSAAVDWWAFGVLVYEMMKTTTPFFHEKGRKAIFQGILKADPTFPMHFSSASQVGFYVFR
jgi:serine/threonine protein kinase